MKLHAILAAAITLTAFGSGSANADEPTKLRRFAYIIGANDGGAERVKLRYAGSDARKFATLLNDLGGVDKGDVVIKNASSAKDIEAGFANLVPRLRAAAKNGARIELILYYSGHSDERGLLVGETRLEYSALRKLVSSMPADVNIAILDSCASGAFTRTKGGKREQAFLLDESSKVTGYAFISSSSENEVAQESDRIAASFFTHYLISGLRGGADANRDGRVTLNEAYQFAFAETVARTESTVGGAQHPAYNMHLAGTGDVIVTDLRAASASLVVAKAVRGRLFIRDAGGGLVLEINKTGSHPVELGLSPGTYAVTLKRDGKLFLASIKLSANRRTTLGGNAFKGAPLENAVARGAAPGMTSDQGEPGTDGSLSGDYVEEPLRLSLVPALRFGSKSDEKTRTRLSLNILVGDGDALDGLEVGGLVNTMRDDVRGLQAAGLANVVLGNVRGVQAAGLTNIVMGSSRGVRAAGLVNYTGGSHRGLAASGLINASMTGGRGVSGAGVGNYSGGAFAAFKSPVPSISTTAHSRTPDLGRRQRG